MATASGSRREYRPGEMPIGGGDPNQDGMSLSFERGALDQNAVDDVLERSAATLIGCYKRAGVAQKYVAGNVVLRFFIASNGAVSDVRVVSSELGNYGVERCLVIEGSQIVFPAPGGNEGTDFEYSLRFRSSGEVAVLEWDPTNIAGELGILSPQLASCGVLGPSVRAVAYIEPSGIVGSVGLAADFALDPMIAICVVEQIRKWRLAGDGAHVVRTSFPVVAEGKSELSSARRNDASRRSLKRAPRRSVR